MGIERHEKKPPLRLSRSPCMKKLTFFDFTKLQSFKDFFLLKFLGCCAENDVVRFLIFFSLLAFCSFSFLSHKHVTQP